MNAIAEFGSTNTNTERAGVGGVNSEHDECALENDLSQPEPSKSKNESYFELHYNFLFLYTLIL